MKRKIIYNMMASLFLDITSLICSFILPRLIIVEFGSAYNGIVSSVSQFLSVITLLRGGVGGVTRAALYKPLVDNDEKKISAILKATEQFMRRISYIFLVFLIAFASVYPLIIKEEFEWFFTFSLILIIGISTFAQYYFGITYQFLLQADQKQYVYYLIQTGATILNTILSVVLINNGIEFRTMKLISSIVFALIPISLYWFVHKKYKIIKDILPDKAALEQRWDAFAHQIAAFVHNNTDLIVLTLFTDLYQVSVYSVYNMVISGVTKFVNVFSNGIESVIGRLLAKEEQEKLQVSIEVYELIINVVATIAFSCTAILIVPFMQIYTQGASDVNYLQPIFACVLSMGFFFSCVRLPYQNIVEAAGHFKKTRNGAIFEAMINIVVSIICVKTFKCIGVAIGTTVAMIFRTFQYALYASKYIIHRDKFVFYKRLFVSAFILAIIGILYIYLDLGITLSNGTVNYFSWFFEAIVIFCAVTIITVGINGIMYAAVFKKLIRMLIR